METQIEPKKFLDMVREHLTNEAFENNLSKETIEKHGYQYANLEKYLLSIGLSEILIHEIRIRHMEGFKQWMYKNTPTRTHSHVARHLRMCRNACDLAVRSEYMDHNNLSSLKLKRDKDKEVVSCEVFELRKFEKIIPIRKTWQIILDAFLFQCYTGLSFMDLWLFELVDDVIILPNGEKYPITWVTCITGRGKTKKRYWAEFIPEARVIYDKYEGIFPKIWNQTYNRIIKRIAKDIGVNKIITTHIGRKTFATLMRGEGYSIPAIADMLGNTEDVARRNYIAQNKELIIKEIIRVKQLDQFNQRIAS